MKAKRGEVPKWIEEHAAWTNEDCLIWPFARDTRGYGIMRVDGRSRGAHRMMCMASHGAPADETLEAAHSCGNGHLGCVNPRHLRWATTLENARDRSRHGRDDRRRPPKKLSSEQVRLVLETSGRIPSNVIAKQMGVSESLVSRIRSGARRKQALAI